MTVSFGSLKLSSFPEMIQYKVEDLPALCAGLAGRDSHLQQILDEYGCPPEWTRPNSFSTLVLTILEQQVSLASAYAAYKKLSERIPITPENLLSLGDEDLRACYLSRQKIVYTRGLATAILEGTIDLEAFERAPDEAVRVVLKGLKGIGDWTVDIYLIHALQRADVLPVGDLALVNAVKMVKGLATLSREELLLMGEAWRPHRSVATMMFWHYYIKKRNIRLLH